MKDRYISRRQPHCERGSDLLLNGRTNKRFEKKRKLCGRILQNMYIREN